LKEGKEIEVGLMIPLGSKTCMVSRAVGAIQRTTTPAKPQTEKTIRLNEKSGGGGKRVFRGWFCRGGERLG